MHSPRRIFEARSMALVVILAKSGDLVCGSYCFNPSLRSPANEAGHSARIWRPLSQDFKLVHVQTDHLLRNARKILTMSRASAPLITSTRKHRAAIQNKIRADKMKKNQCTAHEWRLDLNFPFCFVAIVHSTGELDDVLRRRQSTSLRKLFLTNCVAHTNHNQHYCCF